MKHILSTANRLNFDQLMYPFYPLLLHALPILNYLSSALSILENEEYHSKYFAYHKDKKREGIFHCSSLFIEDNSSA